ncbi:uncharacterized protein LOC144098263 isoform X2 [Amblyomma americanum]
MEQTISSSLLTAVTLCLFYHWMVVGVIMGFVFTLALEPEKIEKESYFILVYGDLGSTEHYTGLLWGVATLGLSIQAVNVAATLRVFRAVHHKSPRSMSSGAVLLATSNAMEAIFGLAFLFVPPFLPKSIKFPRVIWVSKLLISTPFAISLLYYANSRTEEMTEYERRRILEVDFPLVYVRPESDERGSKVLVALPVQTARTPALESTLVEPNGTGAEKTTESDSSEASDSEAEVSKVAQGVKKRKRRSNITLTTA